MRKPFLIALMIIVFSAGTALAISLPQLYVYYSGSDESQYQLEQISFTADGLEFGTEPITF